MKQYIKNINILVFKLLVVTSSFSTIMAQETIPAAGGNALGIGGSVSYSIGQLFYQTNKYTGGSVAEGIQLPYEISIVTATEEAFGIKLAISAYPNPTADYLTLQTDAYNRSNLSYHIYDLQGKLLQSARISDVYTHINMGSLVPAVYFIKVIHDNSEVKIFKIVKH